MYDLTNLNDEQDAPAIIKPAPVQAVPSVSRSAMLVELVIGVWSGRKLDKRASTEITAINSAERGVANVHKKLLANCQELDAVNKYGSRLRQMHYAMTLPWSDSGPRLLPTQQYFKYKDQMDAAIAEFHRMVDDFLDAYEWEITQAEVKLGAMFHRDEYPSVDSLRHKFYINCNYIPLPSAGDWRIDISNEAEAQLRKQYADYYTDQLNRAMLDMVRRAHEVLGRMSDRLDYVSDADKKVFHDTLVDNVLEIVELFRSCNVTGDPVIEEAYQRLSEALNFVTPADLRKDAALRRATKRAVDDVLASLPSLEM